MWLKLLKISLTLLHNFPSIKDTKQLLTGPRARQMVKKHRDGIQEIDMEQWMVFILSRCEETFELKRNMWVLYHKVGWVIMVI